MSTTKPCRGLRRAATITYLLAFSAGLLHLSCAQDTEPDRYSVRVKNAYFESIDSVKLGSHAIGAIERDSVSSPVSVSKGMYDFYCLTQSTLRITAQVDIRGRRANIVIKLNEKGNVVLE